AAIIGEEPSALDRGFARGGGRLQAKCVDKSRKRGGLLPPTRVVEKEAGERRAPIFEDPDKCSTRDVRRGAIVRHERQSNAIDRRTYHELDIVDDERSVHRDCQRLLTFVELPPVDTLRSMSKV